MNKTDKINLDELLSDDTYNTMIGPSGHMKPFEGHTPPVVE